MPPATRAGAISFPDTGSGELPELIGKAPLLGGNRAEALAAILQSAPDVVLMDINLPGASGVEATRRTAQIAPATAVLVISMVDDDSVFAALAAGARGYVLKGASATEITAALRTVAAGGAVFGAGIASRLLTSTPARRSGPVSLSGRYDLTAREREVPDLLAVGAGSPDPGRSWPAPPRCGPAHSLEKSSAIDRATSLARSGSVGISASTTLSSAEPGRLSTVIDRAMRSAGAGQWRPA